MKMKRKLFVASTITVAIGAIAGGVALTANAMGTTAPASTVKAVVGTVQAGADGKRVVCSYDIDLNALATATPVEAAPASDAIPVGESAASFTVDAGTGEVKGLSGESGPVAFGKAVAPTPGSSQEGPAVPAVEIVDDAREGTPAECAAMKPESLGAVSVAEAVPATQAG